MCVCVSPAQEGSQVAVALRPEYKVPVIGHQDISENSDGPLLQGFGQDALESRIIGGFFKQWQPRHPAIEGMINQTSRSNPRMTSHADMLATATLPSINEPRPLFFSLNALWFPEVPFSPSDCRGVAY